MLPATTVGYVSADVNPSGTTQAHLNRLKSAFTGQSDWSQSAIAAQLKNSSTVSGSGSACFRKASKQFSAELKNLGHELALAMTSADGINLRPQTSGYGSIYPSASMQSALKNDFVLLAPIHVQMTLLQALTNTGLSFTIPSKVATYGGVTIYSERVTGCAGVPATGPSTFYAAQFKDWLVLGLTPQSLHPIIDTANGNRPALSSVSDYNQLKSRLPGDRLATFYLRGSALKQIGLLNLLKSSGNPTLNGLDPSKQLAVLFHSSAGALSVTAGGLSFEELTLNGNSITTAAPGELAASLPSDTEILDLHPGDQAGHRKDTGGHPLILPGAAAGSDHELREGHHRLDGGRSRSGPAAWDHIDQRLSDQRSSHIHMEGYERSSSPGRYSKGPAGHPHLGRRDG